MLIQKWRGAEEERKRGRQRRDDKERARRGEEEAYGEVYGKRISPRRKSRPHALLALAVAPALLRDAHGYIIIYGMLPCWTAWLGTTCSRLNARLRQTSDPRMAVMLHDASYARR